MALETKVTGITLKSLFLGVLCSFFLNVVGPYTVFVLHTAGMSADFITAGAVFLFFILVGGINSLLKLIGREWALSTPELVVVYIMMIVASVPPTWGLMGNLPSILGGNYYATPENDWERLIMPYVKDWLIPNDPLAAKYLYEGLPKGMSIPWSAWKIPAITWSALILVVYFVMICMMVIIRAQWTQRERLIFPLMQLPLEMLQEGKSKSIVSPFFKSKLMWGGFLIPFILLSTRGLHHYFHQIPPVELTTGFMAFRRTTWMYVMLCFPILGFTYFINLDVAFSLWFFHVLAKAQTGVFRILGVDIPGRVEVFTAMGSPSISHQGMGAMIVLIAFGLWMGRGHLKLVFSKAFTGNADVDDSNEALSYRTAVFGMIGGMIFISIWLWLSGMQWWVVPIFLIAAFIIFLSLARVIAEGGVGFCRSQMIPQPFVVYGLGTEFLTPSTLVSLVFTYSWVADIRTTVMASSINGFKLADSTGVRKRPLFWVIMLAIVVGSVTSGWMTLMLAYRYGGVNLQSWFFDGMPHTAFDFAAHKMNNPVTADIVWPRWLFTGIGAAIMAVLMLLRHRLVWWPLHYLGFPISDTWVMTAAWFSIMLGWLFKWIILKYGGIRLYRTFRPFFLGMILGQISCAAVWMVIDYFAHTVGNYIHIGVP